MNADDTISVWGRPGFLVRRLHQISVAIFLDEMRSTGITPVQFGALSEISARPGIDQSALGTALGIDRANVADVVMRLEGFGYVTRKPSTVDRRMKTLFIEPEGERVLSEALGNFRHVQSRLMEPLRPAERNQFITLLARLIEENNDLGRAPLSLKAREEKIAPK